jgi:hypothetical protein
MDPQSAHDLLTALRHAETLDIPESARLVLSLHIAVLLWSTLDTQ